MSEVEKNNAMGQPVVHFEVIGKHPDKRLCRYYVEPSAIWLGPTDGTLIERYTNPVSRHRRWCVAGAPRAMTVTSPSM